MPISSFIFQRSSKRQAGSGQTRLLFLVALISLIASLAPLRSVAAQVSDTDTGREVMVDYIVHFAHHVQWPIEVFNGTGAPFRMCLMGEVEVAAPLEKRMHHRRIQGRMVAVEKISKGEIMRARGCQIVVMGGMDHASLVEVVTALEFFPVLTISDESRFAVLGGMIEFAGSGASMALQLNKTRLDRAELKVGSSLFRLSRQVSLEGRP
ncbi:YfiR family protein [Microbulbifer sp. SA54]|uniref:YfiR family protein n=1 Tax=Microbulbifer sp. SA54 TaxID=3401577 RepID=UPI003AAF8603